eukprot:GHVU01151556.1.p1 GENE.GHVU01151556.1~~GHVU01151556.1.p1  ORF type:complete len:385 (+),score=12.34 GHVU01151556.1:105-1259(+)
MMRHILLLALILVLILAVTAKKGHGGWQKCYSCVSQYSNDGCNRQYQTCHPSQQACKTVQVKKPNGYISITKSCVRLSDCPLETWGGGVQCKGNACYYCCVGDLCNKQSITPGVWTTPSPGPVPGTCPLGCKGEQGIAGYPGPAGPQGPKGESGRLGMPGIPGHRGVPGIDGRPGLPGVNGEYGPTGVPGAAGAPGSKGAAGNHGFDGTKGGKGPKGDRGAKGADGDCSSQCQGQGQGQIPVGTSFIAFSGFQSAAKQEDNYVTLCPTTIHVNLGGAYNQDSGKLTIRVPGTYYFSCVSIADGSGATPCELFKNNDKIFTTSRDEDATGPYPIGTNQALVQLTFGDTVEFKIPPKKGGFWGSISNKFKSPSDITVNGYLVHANN